MAAKQGSVVKASDALLKLLNDAIAREIQVAIQYMWQHVQWGGVKGFAVHSELQSIAVAEMKHAEAIAERLYRYHSKGNDNPGCQRRSRCNRTLSKDCAKSSTRGWWDYQPALQRNPPAGGRPSWYLHDFTWRPLNPEVTNTSNNKETLLLFSVECLFIILAFSRV